VFLLNARVVLKPTARNSYVVLRAMAMNCHIVLRPTGTDSHVILRPTGTNTRIVLRLTTIVVSNRAFLCNLLINHQPIQMAIIPFTNLHTHVLYFWDPTTNKRTKSCHAFIVMANTLKEKLTLRRRMKGRQGRNRRNRLVVFMPRSMSQHDLRKSPSHFHCLPSTPV
jgi:hypothetical protein